MGFELPVHYVHDGARTVQSDGSENQVLFCAACWILRPAGGDARCHRPLWHAGVPREHAHGLDRGAHGDGRAPQPSGLDDPAGHPDVHCSPDGNRNPPSQWWWDTRCLHLFMAKALDDVKYLLAVIGVTRGCSGGRSIDRDPDRMMNPTVSMYGLIPFNGLFSPKVNGRHLASTVCHFKIRAGNSTFAVVRCWLELLSTHTKLYFCAFCLAQRLRCASAILAQASALIFLLRFLVAGLVAESACSPLVARTEESRLRVRRSRLISASISARLFRCS